MNLDDYRKVQEYKRIGLSQKKIMDLTGLKEWDVRRLYHFTIDDFNNYLESKGSGIGIYNEYIINLLRNMPSMHTSIYLNQRNIFSFDVGKNIKKNDLDFSMIKKGEYSQMKDVDLNILDEIKYLPKQLDDILFLYKSNIHLWELRNFIFITNKRLDNWTSKK